MSLSQFAGVCFIISFVGFTAFVALAAYISVKQPRPKHRRSPGRRYSRN